MLQPRRLRGRTQAQRSPAERRLEHLVDAGLGQRVALKVRRLAAREIRRAVRGE